MCLFYSETNHINGGMEVMVCEKKDNNICTPRHILVTLHRLLFGIWDGCRIRPSPFGNLRQACCAIPIWKMRQPG